MDNKQELFILQTSFLTTLLLIQINNQGKDFFNMDIFNGIKFTDDKSSDRVLHEYMKRFGTINQGSLIMILYCLFVMPKETFFCKYKNEFKELNKFIDTRVEIKLNNYKKDSNGVDYVRHIRNAISHVSVRYTINGEEIIISDENTYTGERCEFSISKDKLSDIIDYTMKKIFMKNLWN